ncbi:MAG: TetR/AcrR family transcriptional regulator [Acidimicrobiales bacterium]
MPRAKLRTPALRDQVLRAAVATLAEQGVAGFTARRVADVASTSVPAVYELFGDKAGLVREVFFDGFRQLGRQFERLSETDDPRADLLAVVEAFRRFVRQNPVLAEVMFSRPFVDFDPGPDELRAGAFVRELIVARVRRTIDAGLIDGNATDIAHVLLAQAQGLAAQERAGWLGTSRASMNRRWSLAFEATLDGLAP